MVTAQLCLAHRIVTHILCMPPSESYSCTGGAVNYDDSAVTKTIDSVKSSISDLKTTMSDIKDSFTIGVAIFYGVCCVMPIFVALWGLCSCSCVSYIFAWITAGFLFLAWFLFIMFYMFGVIFDDTCVNLSQHYHLDCMLKPGLTCSRAKLTDFFQ